MKTVGLSSLLNSHPNATSSDLYALLLEKAATFDALGKYGLVVKVVRSHVMLMGILFAATVVAILLSTILLPVVLAVAAVAMKAAERVARFMIAGVSCVFSVATSCLSGPKQKRKRKQVVVPEFTDFFRKSVKRNFRPDRALGSYCQQLEQMEDNATETPTGDKAKPKIELICVWKEDAVANGVRRQQGERKRTWEAMQAPVKSYAIEMNSRYTLAVKEVEAAWKAIKQSEGALLGKVSLAVDGDVAEEDAAVATLVTASITATEPVSRPEVDDDASKQPERVSGEAEADADHGEVEAAEPADDAIAGGSPIQSPSSD